MRTRIWRAGDATQNATVNRIGVDELWSNMPQADVFQQIRTQFQEKAYRPLSTGDRTKVLARNDVHFISELPNKWRADYERRQGHRHTGFFAYNHLPYKTFGDLKHTDVYDLMGDRLGITVTKQHAYSHVYNRNHFVQDHDEQPSNTYDPHQTIKVVRRSSQRKSLPHSRNAGLSSLQLALGANQRSTREMNAGSAFRDVLKREEERKTFLEEIRAPKVVRQQEGQPCQVHNPSLFLPQMVHTASSKACLTLSDAFHMKPPGRREGGRRGGERLEAQVPKAREAEVETWSELEDASNRARGIRPHPYVTLAAAHFKLHHTAHMKVQECSAQTSSVCDQQKRRKCLAKVKLVHAVLCCLHNIRMRDLRSKEPLKAEVISAISQYPLHSSTRDTYDAHPHHPHHPNLHHCSRYDTHTPTLLRHHRLPSIFHHYGGLLTHEHSLDGAHRHTHHTRHHTHLTPHHKPHRHGASRYVKIQAGSGIETWEDILSVDTGTGLKGHAHQHATTTHGPHPPQSATAQHPQKSTRRFPPWQRQVMYVDTDEDNKRTCSERQIRESVDAFQHRKNELAQGVRDTLSARKQHLQKHLVAKLQALPLRVGAGTAEKCLEEMRERAYQASCEEMEGEEKEKPAWYIHLEKELNGVCEPKKDAEVKEALEKLKQFVCVDNSTVHHVIEKLCLLVMSLPANHLCLQPVVSAIEFVLEHILKAPPQLYSQWLDLRQLPHITTELPQHAFVFDMSL